MSTLVKVGLAAAAGAFLAEYIKPQLEKVSGGNETLAKVVGPASIGLGAAAAYWVIGKAT